VTARRLPRRVVAAPTAPAGSSPATQKGRLYRGGGHDRRRRVGNRLGRKLVGHDRRHLHVEEHLAVARRSCCSPTPDARVQAAVDAIASPGLHDGPPEVLLHALLAGGGGQLLDQPGLADPGLPAHQRHQRLAGGGTG